MAASERETLKATEEQYFSGSVLNLECMVLDARMNVL